MTDCVKYRGEGGMKSIREKPVRVAFTELSLKAAKTKLKNDIYKDENENDMGLYLQKR